MKDSLYELYEHKKLLIFAGGIATAIIGNQIIKSEKVKKSCTQAMAKMFEAKKDAEEYFQNMKDDAEDIVEDVRKKDQKEIYVEADVEEK